MASFRVMIVDDEEDFVETIVKRLRDRGLSVEGVNSGTEALSLLETKEFDVVILDQNMPGKDGITVLKELKKKWPQLEVVILTGFGFVDSALDAFELGAYDYTTKPIKLNDLEEKISQAFQRKILRA